MRKLGIGMRTVALLLIMGSLAWGYGPVTSEIYRTWTGVGTAASVNATPIAIGTVTPVLLVGLDLRRLQWRSSCAATVNCIPGTNLGASPVNTPSATLGFAIGTSYTESVIPGLPEWCVAPTATTCSVESAF